MRGMRAGSTSGSSGSGLQLLMAAQRVSSSGSASVWLLKVTFNAVAQLLGKVLHSATHSLVLVGIHWCFFFYNNAVCE